MKHLVQLVKEGRVLDAYTVEATSEDDLAEACSKAIAHFRKRHGTTGVLAGAAEVRIEIKKVRQLKRPS